jgi:hypothetical protein
VRLNEAAVSRGERFRSETESLCCGSKGELSREERVKKDDLDIFDMGATVIFESAAAKV